MIRPIVVASLVALAGCAGTTGSSLPPRIEVARRLEVKLAADPNRALCEQITRALAGGDRDALKPLFDFASFGERVIARRTLPPDTVAWLRKEAGSAKNFGRYYFPDGSQFRCLGTRAFLGEPHIAIRQWTSTRHDYVLIHLTGRTPGRPVDDYHVVSSGFLHSELQAVGLDPALDQPMKLVGSMLQQSYRNDFAGIMAAYRTLPPALRDSPVAFFHFINAVFTTEDTGSELYRATTARLEEVMKGRTHALAYWRRIDARRRADAAGELAALASLIELLDDFELLQ